MDGLTLDTLMRRDRHIAPFFEGVFASDTLPRALGKRPALLISNTDPISKPGSHWVAMYIGENGEGEYWDSYGLPPLVRNHKKFLQRMCKKYTYNHKSLQSLHSEVCGEYCVLYLVHRAHGISLHAFLKQLFSPDPEKNDQIVRTMFKRMFSHQKLCVLPSTAKVQRSSTRRK